jgi:transposase-like protein/xanthosine utilization system XapX-like protein
MGTQFHLPANPAGAQEINSVVAIVRQQEQVAYFASGIPVFTHKQDDRVGQRVATAELLELGLATQQEVSTALGLNRTTLYRQRRSLRESGVLGVVDEKRGPRRRHRFDENRCRQAQQLLNEGESIRQVAKRVGVSEGIIRHALRRKELNRPEMGSVGGDGGVIGPAARSERDATAYGGVAVKRYTERMLARLGKLSEAAPEFVASEAVRYGGALLALPALAAQGVLEAGKQTYGALKGGFYGLQATLLVLALMALLRIRTPEQLQGHPPGELGILLGLDRTPEVKTLRRKLCELAARRQSTEFSKILAERWVDEAKDAVGILYVDGHVWPYNGGHKLQKEFVSRRRLSMPATTDTWVNLPDSQPLFVVTAEANDGLLAMLRGKVLPEIRRLVGERRVTVAFDREGWSPKFFRECYEQGFDVITYRKGKYANWSEEDFEAVSGEVDGRQVSYELAERWVEVMKGFEMREVRRLCESGHQTSVVTTRRDLSRIEVADRMFERWRQENFFRYMRQHFALDALVSYAVEPADPERSVPNPKYKALQQELRQARTELKRIEQEYAHKAREYLESHKKSAPEGFEQAHAAVRVRIEAQHHVCEELKARRAVIPKRVAIKELLPESEIVKLEPETKHLTDTIKMVAYRAETALVRLVAPHYARSEEEGRALVREMLLSSADILPRSSGRRLVVKVHSQANPRSNQALAHLCEVLNEQEFRYPGTDLTLAYEAAGVA